MTSRPGAPAAIRRRGLLVTAAATATAVAVAIAVGAVVVRGGANYTEVAFTDPGRFTGIATAVLRVLADASGSLAAGSLLFAAGCVSPTGTGRLTVDGYRAVLLAQRFSLVWAASALLLTPVIAANTVGQPIGSLVRTGEIGVVITQTLPSRGWLVGAVLGVAAAVASRMVMSWAGTVGAAMLAGLALLPPAVAGNAGEGLGHDVTTTAIIVHVLASATWLGASVALAWHLLHRGSHTPHVVRRFGILSVGCAVALGVSGIALGANLVGPGQLFSTQYGELLLVKSVALVAATGGSLVLWHRCRHRSTSGLTRPLGRASRVPVLLAATLLTALGMSVAMAQQPAPAFLVTNPTPSQQQLGYSLPDPPGLETFLFDWRFDLLLGSTSLLLASGYVIGVVRLRRRGARWPWPRTVSFLTGCAVLLLLTSSGITAYAEATFSLHMVAHMGLDMVVPILLVLGGPVTLIGAAGRSTSPGSTSPGAPDEPPEAREKVEWLLRTAPVRLLTHPVGAIAVFTAALFGIYLTPVFGYAVGYHWFHEGMNLLFLISGYFLFWQVVGIDPLPHRLPHLARLGVLVALMPVHALFGVAILTQKSVMGLVFYGYLFLPWLPDQLSDQRLGGLVVWIGGELPLLAATVVLLVQWRRSEGAEGAVGAVENGSAGHIDPVRALWEEFDRGRQG